MGALARHIPNMHIFIHVYGSAPPPPLGLYQTKRNEKVPFALMEHSRDC